MAEKSIDYFFTVVSPFTYLGHERFLALARKHGLAVNFKPCDVLKIFTQSGGLPVGQRPPQRQAYRLQELNRWKAYFDFPFTVQPKHFPTPDSLGNRLVIAAGEAGLDQGRLAQGFLRAVWAEERDLADPAIVTAILRDCGAGEDLLKAAEGAGCAGKYDALTQEGMDRQIFGAPTWIYNDELFWGQDRLDMLDWRLNQG